MKTIFFSFLSILFFSQPLLAQAVLKGKVVFDGTAPAPDRVEVKSDIPTCGNLKEVPKIVVSKDGGVSGAFVKIIGATGPVELSKETLDQQQCEFAPAIQALPVGSTLVITSSDSVLHNAHGFYEDGSTAFNIAVPISGMELSQKLPKTGMIKLRCDAGHTWMKAYVFVMDHPYYAVTDAEGQFSITGVPAGSYEIEIWQDWLGSHREPVSLVEGETLKEFHLTKKDAE